MIWHIQVYHHVSIVYPQYSCYIISITIMTSPRFLRGMSASQLEVEKTVEVPQVVYEEVIVEVPEVEIKDLRDDRDVQLRLVAG